MMALQNRKKKNLDLQNSVHLLPKSTHRMPVLSMRHFNITQNHDMLMRGTVMEGSRKFVHPMFFNVHCHSTVHLHQNATAAAGIGPASFESCAALEAKL